MIDAHLPDILKRILEELGQDSHEEFHSGGQRAPGRELTNRAFLASHGINENARRSMRPGDKEFLSEKSPLKKAFSITIIKM